ncbi:MAG: HAMP domain-containing protein [Chloroflexi bacterium]|nr:HAMP domain-containing protein [Chloroflexota bacterium]
MRSSIRQRFGLGLIILVMVVGSANIIARWSLGKYRTDVEALIDQTIPQLDSLLRLQTSAQGITQNTLAFLQTKDDQYLLSRTGWVRETERLIGVMDGLTDDTNQPVQAAYVTLRRSVQSIIEDTQTFIDRSATDDPRVIERRFDQVRDLNLSFDTRFKTYRDLVTEEGVQRRANISNNPLRYMNVLGVIGVIALIGMTILFHHMIFKPIRTLQKTAQTVAAGDYAQRAEVKRLDEIGDVFVAFNHLLDSINNEQQALRDQVERVDQARHEAEIARSDAAAQLDTIQNQRAIIRSMSVPILPVGKRMLVVPLIGELGPQRLKTLQTNVLGRISTDRPRWIIIDVTGVPVIDNMVSEAFSELIDSVRLLGSEPMLVGIRPEVAQALVTTGMNFNSLVVEATLQAGIAYAERHS